MEFDLDEAKKKFDKVFGKVYPKFEIFITRFVIDVMKFTLPICGYEFRIEGEDSERNDYSRPNMVRIAGVNVLRFALLNRDYWKKTLIGFPRNCGRDSRCFGEHFTLVTSDLFIKEETLQWKVLMALAFCNEIALVLHFRKRNFSLLDMAAGVRIALAPLFIFAGDDDENEMPPRLSYYSQKLENLFPEVENVWEYSLWIQFFIRKHAVPYGSTTNVTNAFHRETKRRWMAILSNEPRGQIPSNERVKMFLGMLPKDVYEDIAAESPVQMPPYLAVTWGERPSLPPRTIPWSTWSDSESEETAQSGQSGKGSSEQAAPGDLGILPKDVYEKIAAESPVPIPPYLAGTWGEPPSLPPARKILRARRLSTRSGSESGETAQCGQSSKDSSEQVPRGGRSDKGSSEQAARGDLGMLPKDVYEKIAAESPVPMPPRPILRARRLSTRSGSEPGETAQSGQSSKDSSEQVARGDQSGEVSSEQVAQGDQSGEVSSEQAAQGDQSGEVSSEQAAQGSQSGKDSSELEIEDDFSRMSLDAEKTSQPSQGAIPKLGYR